VIVWDSKTDTQISEMAGTDQNPINQLSWSPDDAYIAAANGTVRIWNSQSGELIETLPGNSMSVDFSPDGNKLVYAAETDAIQIIPASHVQTATPTPSPTTQAAAQTLRDLLSDPTCRRTCFMGIEPDVTTQTELENLLNQHQLEFTQTAIADGHLIIYTTNPPSKPFLSEGKPVYIDVTADHVDLITLFLQDVTGEQITSAFGAPDAITGGPGVGNQMLYVDEGLIYLFATDSYMSGLVFITPPGRTAIRMSAYLENSQPCIGTANLCAIGTATPTPMT
jgi:hypothetical protein